MSSLHARQSSGYRESGAVKRRKTAENTSGRRAPYVPTACDACHGRKVRCDGKRPCGRCQKHQAPCSYPVSSSSLDATDSQQKKFNVGERGLVDSDVLINTVQNLQGQLNELLSQLGHAGEAGHGPSSDAEIALPEGQNDRFEARQHQHGVSEAYEVAGHDPNTPLFAGPTSSTFSLAKAKSLLQKVTPEENDVDDEQAPSSQAANHLLEVDRPSVAQVLAQYTLEDVHRLLQTFHEAIGILHPLPVMSLLYTNAPNLLRALKRTVWSRSTEPGDCGLLEIFKLVLAIALRSNGGSDNALAVTLYSSVQSCLGEGLVSPVVHFNMQILFLLAGIFHFLQDDLRLASRMVLVGARRAMEDGLYQYDELERRIKDEKCRKDMMNVLWSLFVLHRQFDYATGVASFISDTDIDLPEAEDAPYLRAMVAYVKLGAQAWSSIVKNRAPTRESIDFFRYQLAAWHTALSPEVKFDRPQLEDVEKASAYLEDDLNKFLKVLLYLRANQLKILVFRPLLFSSNSARSDKSLVDEVVTTARLSITVLSQLASLTHLYDKRHAILNHFLASALAVLILAAVHDALGSVAGTKQQDSFLPSTDEMQAGLLLLHSLRSSSLSADRLWKSFSTARNQLEKLGYFKTASLNTAGALWYPSVESLNAPEGVSRPSQVDFGLVGDERDALSLDLDDPWLQWFQQDDGMDMALPFEMPSWM